MACGTGKTLTALWITEALVPSTTLVLVPSLSLLSQTLSEWAKNANSKWDYLCVCSDETVNKTDDAPISTTDELPFDVTTKPADIAAFLERRRRKIIFSTYQSSAQVAKAQKITGKKIDLVICDEAHRLTGKNDAEFATALDDTKIPAKKRLFMTATPRTYTVSVKAKASERGVEITSMDDETVFGKELHKLSFGQAIQKELLTDYRVVIVGVTDPQVQELIKQRELVSVAGKIETDARTLAAHIGLAKATKDYDLKRTISFHGRIKTAQAFAQQHAAIVEWMPEDHKPEGTIWADTITGAMNSSERRKLLNKIKADAPGQHALLTNARCLTEGVDVPSLDCVAFVDPKSSQVDIIQAVGRAIRISTNKKIGTILIPLLIQPEDIYDHVIKQSDFRIIWEIVKALKSLDDNFRVYIDEFRISQRNQTATAAIASRIVIDLPKNLDVSFSHLTTSIINNVVEHTSEIWFYYFGLLEEISKSVGITNFSQLISGVKDQQNFANWMIAQRTYYKRGTLEQRKIDLLNEIKGWTFNPHEDSWMEGFNAMSEFIKRNKTSRVSKENDVHYSGRSLRNWRRVQIEARYGQTTQGLLPHRKKMLDELEGWEWTLSGSREKQISHGWNYAYESLQQYVFKNGTCKGIGRFIDDNGFHTGEWVKDQRKKYWNLRGKLDENQIKKLESIEGWTWTTRKVNRSKIPNDERIKMLNKYLQENGWNAPKYSYTNSEGHKIGVWYSDYKSQHKRGLMNSEDAVTLGFK
jgi:superfamily II DNA or RNA helicase